MRIIAPTLPLLLALPLIASACSQNAEQVEADGKGEASAQPVPPEPVALNAGKWTIKTDVWKVEGEGIDAATAKAMCGQKAEVAACIDRAGAQRSRASRRLASAKRVSLMALVASAYCWVSCFDRVVVVALME